MINLSAYTISNGYTGMGDVHVVVLSNSEEEALQEASRHFKEIAQPTKWTCGQPDSYWRNLKVDFVIPVLKVPMVVGGSDDQ